MMQLPNVLTDVPAGLYLLTANGELGFYDAQKQLRIDEDLSRVYADHNRTFLRSHIKDPLADDRQIAILYESREPNAWGNLTLSLEELLVRSLYPAGGRALGELTAFQQKSRCLSVYRGMELLLDYRHDSKPDVPVYCPVLFNPHCSLSARISALGREPSEQERDIPVLDVLNLIAIIPPARRASSAVLALIDKLRQGVVRKEQRRDSRLTLQHADMSLLASSQPGGATPAQQIDEGRFHETERVESIECWIKQPHQVASAEQLCAITQFRGLDDARLAKLGERCSIYRAPHGQRLLERGLRDRWNLYLLEGSLSLIAADGAVLRIDAGTDRAARPIASLKPRQYVVETLTPVSFLWIHDQQL